MAYSFTTSGSLPQNDSTKLLPSILGTTPASKAINKSAGIPISTPSVNTGFGSMQLPTYSEQAKTNLSSTKLPATSGILNPSKEFIDASNAIKNGSFTDVQKAITPNVSTTPTSSAYIPTSTTNTTSTEQPTQQKSVYDQARQGLLSFGKGENSDEYNKAVAAELALKEKIAQEKKDINTYPIDLEFQTGMQGALNQQAAERLNAAETAKQAALQEAQLRQGALTSAAELSAPQAGAAFFGSPETGNTVGTNTSLNPVASIPSLVDAVINGQMKPSRAENQLGNPALANALRQEILKKNPNFNFEQAEARAESQAASTSDLTQQASQIQANANGAEANFKLLVDTAKRGGVNNSDVPALNQLNQNLQRGVTSSEAVTLFRNTLSTVRNQYATILGGGTSTDMSRGIAAEQIPDDISLSALMALEQQLKSESANRVAGIQQQINALGGGNSNYSTGGGDLTWDSL